MYITLNSNQEASNSNFINSFSDSIVIKPQSYICCTGAGFETEDTGYNLGTVQSFQFIFQATYNGTSSPLTVPEGDYTLQSLCDTMNALIAPLSNQYTIKLNPNDDADGLKVHFEVHYNEMTETDYNIEYNGSKYNYLSPLVGQDTTAVPDAELKIYGDQVAAARDKVNAIGGILANNYDFLAAGRAPTAATIYQEPTNMPDRYGFEMRRVNGSQTFSVGDGGSYGEYYIYNNVRYVGNATTGNISTINLADLEQDYIVKLSLASTGQATLTSRKNDDTVHTWDVKNFNPGDTFKFIPSQRPNSILFDVKVNVSTNTNYQTAWIPLDFTASVSPGTLPVELNCTNHLSYQVDSPCGSTQYLAGNVNTNIMGSRLAYGSTLTGNGTNFHRVQTTIVGNNDIALLPVSDVVDFNSIMPNQGALYLRRYTGGIQNQVVRLGATEFDAIESSLPTMYTLSFQLVNDGTGLTHCLMGGETSSGGGANAGHIAAITEGTNTVIVEDFSSGTVTITPLTDGTGAAMPNFAFLKSYTISIGSAGIQNSAISVLITDEDGNFYAGTGNTSGTNGRLPNLRYLGGRIEPTFDINTPEERMNGAIWDFRMSQKNLAETIPTTWADWRDIHSDIAAGSVITANAGAVKTDTWYFNNNNNVVWTDSEPTLLTLKPMSDLSADQRFTPVIRKSDGVNPVQTNWVQFGSLAMQHNFTTKLTNMNDQELLSINQGDLGNFGIFTEDLRATTNPLVIGNVPSLELLNGDPTFAFLSVTPTSYNNTDGIVDEAGNEINEGLNIREQIYNICIENLPHRTFNGRTRNLCKSILEVLHNETLNTNKGEIELINIVPKHKIWIPLNNAGDIPINELHIRIANGAMIEVTDLIGDTHIHLEIKSKDEIFS